MDDELARLRAEKEKMSRVIETARREARGLAQELMFGPKALSDLELQLLGS
jgi:hypothetical protein